MGKGNQKTNDRGGVAVLKKYGPEHFSKISSDAHKRRNSLLKKALKTVSNPVDKSGKTRGRKVSK